MRGWGVVRVERFLHVRSLGRSYLLQGSLRRFTHLNEGGEALEENSGRGRGRGRGARVEGRENKRQMSTYYVSHGSPMLALEDTPARDFLKQFAALHVPERPKAILAISAHWDTNVPAVTAVSKNSTIHDFYGFPSELYQLQYPASGMPELARRVKELLVNAGFQTVVEDKKRGLDHGAWVPLLLAYPDADIPVVQLSIQSCKDGAYHYKLGQALGPLKDEGFLVLGSGSVTHNLRQFDFSATGIVPWAKEFDDWLYESLNNNRHEEVINWLTKAPHARRAHPSPDHFMPLLVALGAAGEKPTTERIHSSFQMGTFSMASFAFHGTGPK